MSRDYKAQLSRPIKLSVIALAVASAVMMGASCSVENDPPPPPTEVPAGAVNVLQAVHVEMRPDGSIVNIDSEAMAETPETATPTLVKNSYNPAEVAADLPIRVSTSYRTASAQGTDLSDLAGYTGRVEIMLNVQNLTLKPQTISYDAGGTHVQEQVLVGAPWTVFASTALTNVPPSSVVMTAEDETAVATDGVLAQLPDGSTSVQWASLLLSPSSMSGTTMTLVMDVTNMTVPEFELSAHPGVVGDPRASFVNGATESETQLLQRTLVLAGEVQGVLDDVGESIAEMREALESSTTTFGADAVQGLKDTNTQVETSTQALVDELDGLHGEMGTLLESSKSGLVGAMEQTVSSMQTMLGDPSQIEVPPPTQSGGCDMQTAPISGGETVAGLIGQMSAQLDLYAGAAQECQDQAREAILASIGPEDPTQADACPADTEPVAGQEPTPPPLTCALWQARVSAQTDLTTLFAQERDVLLLSLDQNSLTGAQTNHDELTTALGQVSTSIDALDDGISQPDFEAMRQAVTQLSDSVSALDDWMSQQHQQATTQQGNTDQMVTQNRDTAASVCTMIRDAASPDEELVKVYASLTTQPCVLADGSELQIPDHLKTTSMQTQLADQATAWETIVAQTAPDDPQASGRVLVQQLRDQVTTLEERLDALMATVDGNDTTRSEARAALLTALQQANAKNEELGNSLDTVSQAQEQLRAEVATAFDNVTTAVNDSLSNTIDPTIRQVHAEGQRTAEVLQGTTEGTTSGIQSLSEELVANGQQSLAEQAQALQEASQTSAEYVTQSLDGAGTYLSEGLAGSARDIEGTRAPLIEDLQNALADLGSPAVDGGGLLGSLATSSAAAATTDEQVALANSATSSFSNVRAGDIASIAKGQATFRAGLDALASLPLFQLQADGATHTTVYVVHLRGEQ